MSPRYDLWAVVFRAMAALFVAAVPLLLISGAVTWAVNDPGLYQRGFEKYSVSLRTGITGPDLRQVGADIRQYFNSFDEPLAVTARVFGQERELFNQREVAHMRDVKALIQGVYLAGAGAALYLLGVAAGGFLWLRRPFADKLALLVLLGGMLTLALVLAVGFFALVGFDALFLKFHQLSFSNDFWRLDPRRDYLVMLFPQGFWFDATMRVAAVAVGSAMVLAGLSGAYLLYRRWKQAQEYRRESGSGPGIDVARRRSST